MLAGVTDAAPSAGTPAARGGITTALVGLAGICLALVVVAPIALSSNDLIAWAGVGLGLTGQWPWVVFIALDAAAGVCVLLGVWCAVRGTGGGAFGIGVWVFAGFSAFANYRHGLAVRDTAADAFWFFPTMSLLGPGLLEAVMWLVRRQMQQTSGRRAHDRPKFGLVRWLPVVGSPRDTYGAFRTAQIDGIGTVDEAIRRYHALCPDGSLRVLRAIRARDVRAARSGPSGPVSFGPAPVAPVRRGPEQSGPEQTRPPAPLRSTGDQTRPRVVAASARPSAATLRGVVGQQHQSADQSGDQTGPVRPGAQAVRDAAEIRLRWPDGLPESGAHRAVRDAFSWGSQKATNGLGAYRLGADLSASGGADGP